jgi:hypothetical protein
VAGRWGGRGQRVERQRTVIKPQSAWFIFTVCAFINICYILTIYNTCRWVWEWAAAVVFHGTLHR